MMLHPILEQLKELKLQGMLDALEAQSRQQDIGQLSFEERLALLVEQEVADRESRRLKRRLKVAKLKTNACFEDVSFKKTRGLDRSLVMSLESCQWIEDHQNLLITGATGTGKTYLAEAFSHKACLKGYSALSVRLPRFLDALIQARAEGCYLKRLAAIAKIDLLVLDDFALCPFTDQNRRDFLEIVDDRYKKKSTIVTSQVGLKHWYSAVGDSTLAEAILDRLVHNAYRFELKGDSLRREEVKR